MPFRQRIGVPIIPLVAAFPVLAEWGQHLAPHALPIDIRADRLLYRGAFDNVSGWQVKIVHMHNGNLWTLRR